uniref:olfactory receptor 6N1-like n=1 Tax=Euleptes europaea TaxID=460621 RepID=UPI00253FA8D7|nr:olfactory receptor 6N1-like [Euleptes europaea]
MAHQTSAQASNAQSALPGPTVQQKATGVDCQHIVMLGNETRITEVILLGFRELADFQILLFLTFLVIYIVAMSGNILIFDHIGKQLLDIFDPASSEDDGGSIFCGHIFHRLRMGLDYLHMMMSGNETRITEFILLGLGELYGMQIPLFLIFLVIYIVTLTGNLLIFGLVLFDRHLHTPMYFFLGNLSFMDVCYSTTIFPKMLSALLTGDKLISFSSCLTQWYLCDSLIATECCLLCMMYYDRYLAVCKPLHYETVMKTQTCIQLAVASWINGFLAFFILFLLLLRLSFCGPNEMDHYFCDYYPLLKLTCSDTTLTEIMGFVVAVLFTLCPFLLTLTSYIYILVAVLKIPSVCGRQKAFLTCSSHLLVVCIFYGSLVMVYMLPKTEGKRDLQKFSSLLYVVLPPLINPFIYSLRNK